MIPIKSCLENTSFSYELINHDTPIRSAQEGADIFGIEIGQTAPALIVKKDTEFLGLIVSGGHPKTDFKQVAAQLGCSSLKLANPNEVKQVTGFEPGNVPLIGLTIPCAVDQRLLAYSFVYGGTGNPTCTLKIEPKALLELNQVITTLK
ncbi:MAG: YbaK/EbsC family protein [Bacillaceae bacterium]|nr:YbaK/EbsC family protein [Bacillaceae bacterium]